ncbi:uricase [Dimargaris cristalligena]|uniref:Uricase n=1 Tax=Dimargaris cristalligena TaxID=215637 RepID=A0A4Q0A038_9FUNG|nr:uricase [Dimargaris cristalligena]|eukprot:RKP39375.1 uricase [Dimargaris cristalligena]
MATSVQLKTQSYGKDRVRLVKVVRHPGGVQDLAELTITVLLEGDFEASYAQADNRNVVATDSVKNTIYVLAKRLPSVLPIENFALTIGHHFLHTYGHVTRVHVSIQQHPWNRLVVDDEAHPHAFTRGGEWRRTTQLTTDATLAAAAATAAWTARITSGFRGVSVLKTTGSSFSNFLRDQYTTLAETDDRILSTNIDCQWSLSLTDPEALRVTDFSHTFDVVRQHTLKLFAQDNSASVQATLFRMADVVLRDCPGVQEISYALPNNHVFGVDLKPFGLNNTGANLDVYMPISDPSGLITATITRKSANL